MASLPRPDATRRLSRGQWTGNRWPSIDIWPHADEDFLPTLARICESFGSPMPEVVDRLDGYAADFSVMGSRCAIHMDPWSFSIASESAAARDAIWRVLEGWVNEALRPLDAPP